MKKSISFFVFVVSVLALATSCQQKLTDARIAEIQEQVTGVTEESIKYLNEVDTARYFLHCSDRFAYCKAGEILVLPDQWPDYMAKQKKGMVARLPVKYEITDSWIDVLSPTVANHLFTYNRVVQLPKGRSFGVQLACTYTYVLEGDEWKVRNSHVSYPEEHFRAVEGDTLFLAFLDVKPEKREEFEQLTHEMLFDRLAEADQQAELTGSMMRILHPVNENEDGTLSYLVMFDPFVPIDYDFTTGYLYPKIYGEEKGAELNERFIDLLAGPQRSYVMTQSRH
jgi:hypothetical protein